MGNLRPKKSAQNKRKGVSKKKNNIGLIKDDKELVEKEDKENILEV